jgi:anti-sigma factor RsiW
MISSLPTWPAALAARRRVVLGPVGDLALVHFNQFSQRQTIRVDHGAAQLVQEQPCTLIAAQPELGLKL